MGRSAPWRGVWTAGTWLSGLRPVSRLWSISPGGNPSLVGQAVPGPGVSGHDHGMLPDRQLDMFAGGGVPIPVPVIAPRPSLVASALDDAALIAALPDVTQGTCQDLTGE